MKGCILGGIAKVKAKNYNNKTRKNQMRILIAAIALIMTAPSVSAIPYYTVLLVGDGEVEFIDDFADNKINQETRDKNNCTGLFKIFGEIANQDLNDKGYANYDFRKVMYNKLDDEGNVFIQIEFSHKLDKMPKLIWTCMDTNREMESSDEVKKWDGSLE
jgi:hypothetical protein